MGVIRSTYPTIRLWGACHAAEDAVGLSDGAGESVRERRVKNVLERLIYPKFAVPTRVAFVAKHGVVYTLYSCSDVEALDGSGYRTSAAFLFKLRVSIYMEDERRRRGARA